jgi:type III restriction enzyme
MPLVIGISATPRRFLDLLATAPHTIHKVDVPADEVRTSGLLKDRILIHYPDSTSGAEMTLLAEAAKLWRQMEAYWDNYCKQSESGVWLFLCFKLKTALSTRQQEQIFYCLKHHRATIGRILLKRRHTRLMMLASLCGNRR